jgi:hypothetical protein
MAHRIGQIAWGELDKGIKIVMNMKQQNPQKYDEVDIKRLNYVSETMAKSIKEFADTAGKDADYDAANWKGFNPVGCGGQLDQLSVIICSYVMLNLFILNPKKYHHYFNNTNNWILLCCFDLCDGGLDEFLVKQFKELVTYRGEFTCNPMTREWMETARQLCKDLFKCLYNYSHRTVDADYIRKVLEWKYDL